MKFWRRKEREEIGRESMRIKIANYDELVREAVALSMEPGEIVSQEEMEEALGEDIGTSYGRGGDVVLLPINKDRSMEIRAYFDFIVSEEDEIEARYTGKLTADWPEIFLKNYDYLVMRWEEKGLPTKELPLVEKLLVYLKSFFDDSYGCAIYRPGEVYRYRYYFFLEDCENKGICDISFLMDNIKNGEVRITELNFYLD